MRILRHFIVFAVLIAAAVVLRRSIPPEPDLTVAQTDSSQVQGDNTAQGTFIDIPYEDKFIRVRWFKVHDLSGIRLLDNYDSFIPSVDLYESGECRLLTSGGFYDTENRPLGLVISEGERLYSYRNNVLMNGVISINELDTARISRGEPSGYLRDAVQTGPLLWENGRQISLQLNTDKYSRRVAAIVTGSNELYFAVFYNPSSSFSGPRLSDLPGLVSKLNGELSLNIADAINLDGGSASVFINEEVSLSELSPVGSYWCVR